MWEKIDENIVRIPKYGCSEWTIMLVFLKKYFRLAEVLVIGKIRSEMPRRRPPQLSDFVHDQVEKYKYWM